MNEIITIERMSNRKFLESHALAGRVGLVGGTTLIENVIRRGGTPRGRERAVVALPGSADNILDQVAE